MSKKLNIFSVTSLEKDRIKIIKVNEIDLVEKMTTVKEFANIKKAEKLLNDSDSFINHNNNTKTKILVPKPIKWKENKLLMEYCLGINLESLIMKNDKKRKFYINILFGILSWMKNNSFYWQDFAPRNILYNSTKNTITLVDFESDLIIKTKKNPQNKREHFTRVTPKGLRITDRAMEILNNYHSPMFQRLSAKQHQQLLETLDIMVDYTFIGSENNQPNN